MPEAADGLIQQPPRSKICGQCCIAMAAGVPLAEAVRVIGHRRATKTADLCRALAALGLKTKGRLQIVRDDMDWPSLYIAKVKYPRRRNWHWVLFRDGAAYDPSAMPGPTGRISAILEIS